MYLTPFLSLLLLSVYRMILVSAMENSRTECSCPYKLIYECTLISNTTGVILFWNGSAFTDCNDVILSPSFQNKTSCNNESIVGTLISDENSNYTSQLHVTLDFDIIGKDIQCFHYDNTGQINVIEDVSITVDIHYIESNDPAQNSLYFWWNSSIFSYQCSAVQYTYEILASNCGRCLSTRTNHTNITCTDVPTNGGKCNFTVKTYVCGHFIGSSQPCLLSLKRIRPDLVLLPTLTTGILLLIAVLIMGVIVLLWFLLRQHNRFPKSSGVAMHCQAQNSLHGTDVNVYGDNMSIVKVFDNKLASGIYDSATGEVRRSQYEDYVPTTGEGKIDLKSLIAYLRGRVTYQWYKFGAALGVPSNVLEKFIKDSEKYSEENALIKVLEYWLKNHPTQPSWHEVANALRDIIWTSQP